MPQSQRYQSSGIASSGARRLRVLLETPGEPLPDGSGGWIETWRPLVPPDVWAAIEPVTQQDTELPIAGTVEGHLSHKVTMPFRADVSLETRIQFVDYAGRTRILWVRGLQDPQQRSELLVVWCDESNPPGATPTRTAA